MIETRNEIIHYDIPPFSTHYREEVAVSIVPWFEMREKKKLTGMERTIIVYAISGIECGKRFF